MIDHVIPVAAGGDCDPTNLVTACEPCNQGKRDKLLSKIPIRPDADLLYLEAQQELGELRRYQEVRSQLAEARQQVIATLQDLWCELSGLDWCPHDSVIARMLAKYDVLAVEDAIKGTAPKLPTGYVREKDFERYMWGILRRSGGELDATD